MELYDLLTLHYFLLFIVVKYTISSKNVPVNGPLWQKTHPLYYQKCPPGGGPFLGF